jgi:Glycosyl hydrolase family 12/Cellulose binding domain
LSARFRVLAAAAAVGVAVTAGVVAVSMNSASADTQICDTYGSTTIAGGKYVVMNNNWGDSTQQCINVTSTGFSITTASHNKAQNGAPGAYPAIYAGCHYANCSTGSSLPMQTSDSRFSGISTSVSMSYPNNGSVFDASYDIWFDPTPRTDGQNTGAELMIWLNHTGSVQPVGSKVGTANIAGGTWDVWEGNSGWNVISYVRQSATSSISFNVDNFWSDVVGRGYGQRSWYMTSVQAGFEPWVNGTGLAVNSFSYSVSGGNNPPPTTAPPTTQPPTTRPPTTNPPTGNGSCKVTYSRQSEWAGGFVANLTITAGSAAINGWGLTFAFGGDQKITSGWSATYSQSGKNVTATAMDYDRTIAAGQSVSLGFQGTWTSSDANPTSFAVNGVACS